jgi:Thioredoxin
MFVILALAGLLVAAPAVDAVSVSDVPLTVDAVSVSDIPLVCLDPDGTPGDDGLRDIFEGGRSYTQFLDAATQRVDMWHGNTEKAEGIDAELVRRARGVGGSWKFLAVAVDSCSDSVSTIPYLAELVALVSGLDMRIVDSTVGRAIMDAHRTPDGRGATPTVLLLDDHFEEAGCFIERPPELQALLFENGDWSRDQIFERKMAWYAKDAGNQTVETFVEMLEAAAQGAERVCG